MSFNDSLNLTCLPAILKYDLLTSDVVLSCSRDIINYIRSGGSLLLGSNLSEEVRHLITYAISRLDVVEVIKLFS